MFTVKNAPDLQVGERIVGPGGTVHTVIGRTTLDEYNGCTIFTDQNTILTGLPCPVKVLDEPEGL